MDRECAVCEMTGPIHAHHCVQAYDDATPISVQNAGALGPYRIVRTDRFTEVITGGKRDWKVVIHIPTPVSLEEVARVIPVYEAAWFEGVKYGRKEKAAQIRDVLNEGV